MCVTQDTIRMILHNPRRESCCLVKLKYSVHTCSLISGTVFVILLRAVAETEVHKLIRTDGVPISLTLLFWKWLTVSSVLDKLFTFSHHPSFPLPVPNKPYGFCGRKAPRLLTHLQFYLPVWQSLHWRVSVGIYITGLMSRFGDGCWPKHFHYLCPTFSFFCHRLKLVPCNLDVDILNTKNVFTQLASAFWYRS